MGKNREMNDRLRTGFGRAPAEDREERKQSGIKPVEKMSVEELAAEATIVASRLMDATEELAARAAAGEDEEEEEEGSEARPTSKVLREGWTNPNT